MSQRFLTYAIPDSALMGKVRRALTDAGFAVHDAGRMAPGLAIRIREETNDERAATEIVKGFVPNAEQMPSGAPTQELVAYRDGL